jgi:DNA-binding FadR family transcriptional regulator
MAGSADRTAKRDEELGSLMRFLDAQVAKGEERLPSERELAALLSLSRARLRSCLKVLEDRGLIWRHVGMGTFFGARPANLGSPVSSLAERTNPQEIMEARMAIEPALARMAAIRASQRDIEEMERYLMAMRETADAAQWLVLDHQLHRAIGHSAGNALMLALYEIAHDYRDKELWARLRSAILTPERMKTLNEQHSAVVAAIRDRNPQHAAECMLQHLRSVRDRTLGDA